MSQLPRHLLPESLRTLAEYCGDDVMWLMWQEFGGGRLHVPLAVNPDHRLSQLLGFANACQLCEQFGGEFLTISKAESARRAVRNELIRQAKREGADNFSLARKYNLTDRQIITICSDDAPACCNLDLFENDF